jgi:ubiquinone/menaquinone biosynthesis C-methylase UbiE
MAEMNRSFSGSMPEFYDRFLVPLQFEPFARDLARRLGTLTAGRLLELAAGTGVVSRALARILLASVEIVATDLNPAMLEQAKRHPGVERVTWRTADALALPFADASFDCVVCQFGVMFFPDKRAAFREARRMLRPGGRFLFTVWGEKTGTSRGSPRTWSPTRYHAIPEACSRRNTTISPGSAPTLPPPASAPSRRRR